MKQTSLRRDTAAAATELGYIFTFLLGVMLLTMFSLWAWDIETATRERWNENAIQANMDDLAAAVERADEASRMGSIDYAEKVEWRPTEADESRFTLVLTDTNIELIHDAGDLDTNMEYMCARSSKLALSRLTFHYQTTHGLTFVKLTFCEMELVQFRAMWALSEMKLAQH